MSATAAAQTAEPWLELPGGFPPDTIGFAVRTVMALLLAYYVSFWIQLTSASTAGICVAIVAHPQTGGTLSKAIYRVIGTLTGGTAAVVATAAFGQNRTTLLLVFTLWIAACSFTASLLKDFRAYGATLAGYTLAIVSVTDIDVPQEAFLTALDRIAAILIGVISLALVNSIFGRPDAWQALTQKLRRLLEEITEQAVHAVRGEPAAASALSEAQRATEILALRTEATYVATELSYGASRAAGARSAIAALLGMLSASRAVAFGLTQVHLDPAMRAAVDQAATALRDPNPGKILLEQVDADQQQAAGLPDVFLRERLDDLLIQQAYALDGLAALATGNEPVRRVNLRSYNDLIGATLNATRTAIVVGLLSLFCIYAGWNGATFLLVQTSAVVALLGMQANPTRAAVAFAGQVAPPILFAGLVEFFLLPQTEDFFSFSLAVAPFALVACILARHPRLGAGAGSGMLIWYVLMLAPANPPTYDLATYLNLGLELLGGVLALIVGFAVILPVSPPRRLVRVTVAALTDLRRILRRHRIDKPGDLALRGDRLSAALLWLGRQTPTRLRLLSQIRDLGDLYGAIERVQAGLDTTLRETPFLAAEVATARTAMLQLEAGEMRAAGEALLTAAREAGPASQAMRQAVSGLYGTSLLLQRNQRFLRLAGMPVRP